MGRPLGGGGRGCGAGGGGGGRRRSEGSSRPGLRWRRPRSRWCRPTSGTGDGRSGPGASQVCSPSPPLVHARSSSSATAGSGQGGGHSRVPASAPGHGRSPADRGPPAVYGRVGDAGDGGDQACARCIRRRWMMPSTTRTSVTAGGDDGGDAGDRGDGRPGVGAEQGARRTSAPGRPCRGRPLISSRSACRRATSALGAPDSTAWFSASRRRPAAHAARRRWPRRPCRRRGPGCSWRRPRPRRRCRPAGRRTGRGRAPSSLEGGGGREADLLGGELTADVVVRERGAPGEQAAGDERYDGGGGARASGMTSMRPRVTGTGWSPTSLVVAVVSGGGFALLFEECHVGSSLGGNPLAPWFVPSSYGTSGPGVLGTTAPPVGPRSFADATIGERASVPPAARSGHRCQPARRPAISAGCTAVLVVVPR